NRRLDGGRSLQTDHCACRVTAGDLGSSRRLALYAHVRRYTRAPVDNSPAVPARISILAGKKRSRDLEKTEHRRTVSTGLSSDSAGHSAHIRLWLWRGLWRYPAGSSDCERTRGGQDPAPPAAGASGEQRPVVSGDRRAR